MSSTEQRRGWMVTKVLAGELTVAEAAPLRSWACPIAAHAASARPHDVSAGRALLRERIRSTRSSTPPPSSGAGDACRAVTRAAPPAPAPGRPAQRTTGGGYLDLPRPGGNILIRRTNPVAFRPLSGRSTSRTGVAESRVRGCG